MTRHNVSSTVDIRRIGYKVQFIEGRDKWVFHMTTFRPCTLLLCEVKGKTEVAVQTVPTLVGTEVEERLSSQYKVKESPLGLRLKTIMTEK